MKSQNFHQGVQNDLKDFILVLIPDTPKHDLTRKNIDQTSHILLQQQLEQINYVKRPRVQTNILCKVIFGIFNALFMVLHIFSTVMIYFRSTAAQEDNPLDDSAITGKMCVFLTAALMVYNIILLLFDYCLTTFAYKITIASKWLIQILVLANFGVSAYYIFQCYGQYTTAPTNKTNLFQMLFGGLYTLTTLTYTISFWCFLQ
ncbi:UNKNOWN [Stylonychia lemnae]|uniref:Uncharacterized protein n=1 Tax=Stylonychia lemnae TaxID=5949 RepID=A0A078B5W0_STYLE|nr:UNKNOWN [Stylonychia lemnae]|eukprot:CDW88707.1 UNKNOWN [Stylonychia lemnae]